MSISIWINETNDWIFCEILNSAFLPLGRTEIVTHAFSWSPQSPTNLKGTHARREDEQPQEWGRSSTCSDPMQAPQAQLQTDPDAQQITHHILLWHSGSLLSAPRSPPNGSIQAAEKPCFGQSTVTVPKGTCVCLPLASCAAGRWPSRAHTYPQCACHGKPIQPNNQFKSSSLPLGTAKMWDVALTSPSGHSSLLSSKRKSYVL